MLKKLLKTTLLSSITLGVTLSSAALLDHQVAAAAATLSWSEFTEQFNKAFDAGDVATLEMLKKNQPDFANINDLGGRFLQYGGGMEKWDQLIADALKNKK